jgi:hypothetical protein
MAMNFPDSPSVNQQFTAGGRTWVWDGTTWSALTVSANQALSELLLMGA